MKTSHIVATGLIVVSVLATAPATASDQSRPVEVRLASTEHGELEVPVFIGREGPYPFVLDTGSSHTVIRQTLATTLGAAVIAKAPLRTSVGSILAPVVGLRDVAVGSAHVELLLATSLPPDAAAMLDGRISGVLGQDFLSRFDYTLDYRMRRLSWRGEPVEKDRRLALEASNGRFLVQLPQDERCACSVRLVPDSGANGMVLFAGKQGDRLRLDAAATTMRVSTLGGDETAPGVIVRTLRVGSARLRDVLAARVVLPDDTTEEGDGLLPLSLFARVSFHHREGYMTVQPW